MMMMSNSKKRKLQAVSQEDRSGAVCKACGKVGHSRRSSHLCPLRAPPREGLDPPAKLNGEEGSWMKVVDSCYKVGARSLLKSRHHGPDAQLIRQLETN